MQVSTERPARPPGRLDRRRLLVSSVLYGAVPLAANLVLTANHVPRLMALCLVSVISQPWESSSAGCGPGA
jgi:hypothetical protein